MENTQKITITDNVTLISLNDSPADIKLVSQIFTMLANEQIDVDMISQIPPHGNIPYLSFTVSDDDLGKVFEIASKLREINPELKLAISSGNSKISLFDEQMKDCPGVAAKVFTAIAETNAEVRMITTSEFDISLLTYNHNVDEVYNAIKNVF